MPTRLRRLKIFLQVAAPAAKLAAIGV